MTDYSNQQLIDALQHEYEYLIHDDFDEDVDMTPAEYLVYLQSLTYSELVDETCTDDDFTLSEYMYAHS